MEQSQAAGVTSSVRSLMTPKPDRLLPGVDQVLETNPVCDSAQ